MRRAWLGQWELVDSQDSRQALPQTQSCITHPWLSLSVGGFLVPLLLAYRYLHRTCVQTGAWPGVAKQLPVHQASLGWSH